MELDSSKIDSVRPVPGVLMPYLGNPAPRLLWCPSDRILPRLLRDTASVPQYELSPQLYPFSYGLSCPAGELPVNPEYTWTHGMASSIRTRGRQLMARDEFFDTQHLFYFKVTSVKTSSQKILFADKRMTYEMTEAEAKLTESHASPAWYWPSDTLTRRHNRKGNVALSDGHVETVRPEFGQMKEHYDPLF